MELRKFYAKINFGIPAHFFAKNGVNAGICRRKWIPAFAGMTAGRREFGGENRTAAGGGIPKKTAEFAAKNPPQFPPKTRKTPVIPAKAGIHFEEQNCEFTLFFHKKTA